MKQIFKLKNGEILFEDERIVISDNAKTQYWVLIFITASGAFIGIVSVLNYVEIGQSFLLWAGLFIAVINSLVLLWMLFMTNRIEINKSDIRSIKLKRRLGNKFLDIKLKGYKTRRVNQIDDKTYGEIKQYIELNFSSQSAS